MRVFMTGATGFIGAAVIAELRAAGHTVLGLARSEANVAALTAAGVEPHRGELTDLDSLVAGAAACDGVIHLGFVHDFANFMASVEIDRLAVEAMTGALKGSGKPMVIASGTMMVNHGRPAMEADDPLSREAPRAASEAMVLETPGLRGAVVRLAPAVHDRTRAGLVTGIAQSARAKGVAAYIGEGANRWPAVHVLDAARLFALALDKAGPGTKLHAVAEEGVGLREIAKTIGERLGVPVRSVTAEEAFAYLDTMAMFAGVDNPASSAVTRATMGWIPTRIGLLADVAQGDFLA